MTSTHNINARRLSEREIYLCTRYSLDQTLISRIHPSLRYRASQIALILDISYDTVRRRISAGLIPSSGTFNPSISGSDLLDYIWSCCRSGRRF